MVVIYSSVVLGLVAVLLLVLGIQGLRRLANISSWPLLDATVVSRAVDELHHEREQGGPTHRPTLVYTYTVDGRSYRSSRMGITHNAYDFFSEQAAHAFLARYPPGSKVEIRVSPADPSYSVFDEGASPRKRSHYLAIAVSGGLLASCVVGLAFLG
jgi:hypothetical protein